MIKMKYTSFFKLRNPLPFEQKTGVVSPKPLSRGSHASEIGGGGYIHSHMYIVFCSLEASPNTLVVTENGLKGSVIENYFKSETSIREYREQKAQFASRGP